MGLAPYLVRSFGDLVASRDKSGGRVCIINYHRILSAPDPFFESEPDVKTFRWHMELLANCFNVLPLDVALKALSSGDVPPRAVCITFDDGYRSIHDFALPILREFGLPATVFVTTGTVDGGTMWNDTITEAIRRFPGKQLDLRDIGLGQYSVATVHERKHVVGEVTRHSKYLCPQERLSITGKLENLANAPLPNVMLSREMIFNLAQNGIEIGGHTISHPILTKVDNEQAKEEIREGKQQLEAITRKSVRFFAYPNGKPKVDFDHHHVQMVKDAGYSAAFTTVIGPATASHDRFHLPRSRPWDTNPLMFSSRLLAWLAGKAI